MSFLSRLFGRSKMKPADEQSPKVECFHTVLAAKWDSAQDIGVEDRASRFECTVCNQSFTPDEARGLRDTLAERMRGLERA